MLQTFLSFYHIDYGHLQQDLTNGLYDLDLIIYERNDNTIINIRLNDEAVLKKSSYNESNQLIYEGINSCDESESFADIDYRLQQEMSTILYPVEPQWLEHLWDHVKLFET